MKRVAALVLLLATACVGAARSFPVYESRATSSAEAAQSAVETALSAIDDALHDDAFAPYVSVVMMNAETAATTAQGHFASIQPPDHESDRLRGELLRLLSSASDTIAEARIAARRGDTAELSRLRQPLSRLSHDLSTFLERHQP